MTEHRDLSEHGRTLVDDFAHDLVLALHGQGESLGIAREALIQLFDGYAADFDAMDAE